MSQQIECQRCGKSSNLSLIATGFTCRCGHHTDLRRPVQRPVTVVVRTQTPSVHSTQSTQSGHRSSPSQFAPTARSSPVQFGTGQFGTGSYVQIGGGTSPNVQIGGGSSSQYIHNHFAHAPQQPRRLTPVAIVNGKIVYTNY